MSKQKSKDILEAEALIAKNRAAWNAIQQSTRDYEEKYWNDNKDSLQAQGYLYTKNTESPWGGIWTKQITSQSPAVAQTATRQKNTPQTNTNNVATNMVTTKGGLKMTQQELDFWTKVAQEKGFADVDAVAKWQFDNGLPADGKFGENSSNKYNSIAQANQQTAVTNQQVTTKKQQVATTNQQNTKVNPSTNTTTNSVTQPKVVPNSNNSSGITESDFRNNRHFRNIHGASPNATIDIEGKTYPIMATTGLLGSNSGIENDRVYAFDPETGMVRAVWENFMGIPHKKWANNSIWITPDWIVGPEYDWKKANPMPAMRGPLGGGLTPEYEAWLSKYKAAKAAGFKKQGGTMNKINYFQQGGAAPQQDIKAQVTALVQAAMQGDQKATQTVNQIMEAAKAGDKQAAQIAQMIQQVAQQIQGQATAAKWGAKLGYIRSLKFANGGKTCPTCQAGATVPTVQDKAYIKPNKKVEEKACGGKAKKMKKRYFGGWL